MANSNRLYEFRCPVFGFIELNDWERDIISEPAFQRLRRIRQLALTDYVYPGAMHTRFEHSLGVMHMATLLFDGITQRSKEILENDYGFNRDGLKRSRVIVRIAALLHDVGHPPFSHASEELFPLKKNKGSTVHYKHEDYSAAIVRYKFKSIIEDHKINKNYDIKADDIANFLEGDQNTGEILFWRNLISGQLDADRIDYLLRDSHHTGVSYGKFDWQRLVNTVEIIPIKYDSSMNFIGVNESGLHAAEALILARFFMFTQVYFHKTRVAYDFHLRKAMKKILSNKKLPSPKEKNLDTFLEWDDWKVLGFLSQGEGGEHGQRIRERNHYREIRHTPETPVQHDLEILEKWRDALGKLLMAEELASKSWYKLKEEDIPIITETKVRSVIPLSNLSTIVSKISATKKVSLYVKKEDVDEAENKLQRIGEN